MFKSVLLEDAGGGGNGEGGLDVCRLPLGGASPQEPGRQREHGDDDGGGEDYDGGGEDYEGGGEDYDGDAS